MTVGSWLIDSLSDFAGKALFSYLAPHGKGKPTILLYQGHEMSNLIWIRCQLTTISAACHGKSIPPGKTSQEMDLSYWGAFIDCSIT